jgi:FG-GAP repeat
MNEQNVCSPFKIENTDHTAEQRSGQWLGGSMDGHGRDYDPLVVCAPKRMERDGQREKGVCYYWSRRAELIEKSLVIERSNSNRRTSELGWSVHITDDQKEIVMGDPWKDGVVTRYTPVYDRQTGFKSAKKESWFGYAVTSGHFFGISGGVQYAASEMNPRQKKTNCVKLFQYNYPSGDQEVKTNGELEPDTFQNFGEYFGYTLLAEDFNADGFSDLVVAAPLHSKNQEQENGAVYVYMNRKATSGNIIFEKEIIKLTSPYAGYGRFGTTLAKIGDINKDHCNDLAVAAPYEDNGVVYIFLGGSKGLSTTHSQRIVAPSSPGVSPNKMMFGIGLSRGVDVDGNSYNGKFMVYVKDP